MRTSSAFVGRSDEHTFLVRQLTEPTSATFVVAPAGMGKSRLLREATDRVESGVALTGMSWQGSTATSYFPWIQIASSAARIVNPFSSEYDGPAQDLGPLFPSSEREARFDDRQLAQDLLGIGIVHYLEAIAKEVPSLAVIIEDAHAADPDSIDLATWVIRQRLPVAVVVTSRPYDDAPIELKRALDALVAECSKIELGVLSKGDVEQLLQMNSSELDADDAMSLTRGVPLAVHNWIDSKRSQARPTFRPSSDFRLEQLDAETLDGLRYAALLGNRFDTPTISAVMSSTAAEAMELLQPAVTLGLIRQVENTLTHFAFDHETIREQVSASIGATERSHRHQRVLEVLTERSGDSEHDLATLAHHASYASFVGDPEVAVELNIRAGESALNHSAPTMARRHFDRAIELAELAGSPIAVRLHAEMGAVRALKADASPDFDRAITTLLERVSEPGVPDDVFVDATLLLPTNWSSLAVAPEPDARTIIWLERALERVGDEPTKRRAQVLIELSINRRRVGQETSSVTARELVDEALEIARQLGDIRLESYIYASVQWLSRSPDDIPTILSMLDDFEARTAGGADTFVLSGVRITTLFRAGAFNLARRELDRLESALTPLPPFVAWAIGRWRATLLLVRGDHAGAEVAATEAFGHVDDSSFSEVAFEYLGMQLAVVMRDRIQVDAAEPLLSQMVSTRPDYAAYRAAYAWLLSDLGRHSEARRELAQLFSRQFLWNDETVVEWMPLATMAATAAAELGEVEWCKECIELLDPYKDEWIVWGTGIVVDGPVRLRRAHAAVVAGELDIAREDLRIARQQITAAGARTFFPVLLHHEAQLALREDRLEDAIDLATRASHAASDIGLGTAAELLAAWAFSLADRRTPVAIPEQESSPQPTAADLDSPGLRGSFQRNGSSWTLRIGDDTFTVMHVKGLSGLAELVARPGREVHVLELSAVIDGTSRASASTTELNVGETTDVLLDDEALRQYRSRIQHLEEELDEARTYNDIERESRAQIELDFLMDELRVSTGLGGKSRTTKSSAERARVRVTKSLRTAIGRVSDVSPAIGNHLSNSVQTGTYCSYQPDGLNPIEWDVLTSED